VIVHNDGEKITKWELLLPEDFSSNKTEGVLESNASEQILITFFPKERREYSKYAILKYDGEEAHVNLIGKAINGNVFLSRDSVQMEGTYITLESKSTLRIINKSSVKIDFEWRAFSSEKEDAEKKQLLLNEIENEEKEKNALIREITGYSSGFEEILKNMLDEEIDEIDKDDPGFEDYVEKKKKNAEALIRRKYKILRKEILEDRLIYDDNIFSIQPQTGSIWPNSELTVTITFKPTDALAYLSGAFCNISCSDERLALHLEGEGVGPKAFLSTNILNIGDIFVNEEQKINLYIENKGEIVAFFKLKKPSTTSSNTITFDLEEGKLEVSQRINFFMTFKSNKIGQFIETFQWQLKGSSTKLNLTVKGHVKAPKFEFDHEFLDFGKVSFQFEEVRKLSLTNISNVPFNFSLRIPQDGKGNNQEFDIIPTKNTILPNEVKTIVIKVNLT
jgi:hydrocephalus-inducing protein